MKVKKPEAINLPYQSTVANFSRDQGFGQSFLGAMYAKRKELAGAAPGQVGSGMLK